MKKVTFPGLITLGFSSTRLSAPACVQMVAFVHGHGGSGWHFDDMTEVLRRVDWETGPNFIDINRNPNDTVHLLGDAPARPPNPIAWGADAYNGGHSTHQVHLYTAVCLMCRLSI